jgi:hypothetical protein
VRRILRLNLAWLCAIAVGALAMRFAATASAEFVTR